MKDDRRNYILVGIFVIAMIAGLVAWIAMLSGRTGATDKYYVRYGDVFGLAEGTQIYYDGYPIGRIDSIAPEHDGDPQLFRLDVSVQRGWKIPDDSRAQITASGLLAANVVNIQGGESESYIEPGDRIPSVEAANVLAVVTEAAAGFSDFLVGTLKPQIEDIVADLNQTMGQVNTLLSPQNTGRVAEILVNLENVSHEVAGLSGGLGDTRGQIDTVLGKVERLVAEVTELIETNEADLTRSVVDLHESLEAMSRHADAIASHLELTTRNMDEFSQQIREDPGVLLRGREAAEEFGGAE